MTTDRELLEMAAKAMGLYSTGPEMSRFNLFMGLNIQQDDYPSGYCWNPLTNDSDALRLAVKMGVCFGPNLDGDMAVAFGSEGVNCAEPYGENPYAATRLAIVRAVARLGELMP